MAGELVVADEQFQLRDLLIGPGSKFRWETTPIWAGGADVRTSDTPRSSTHGVRGGRDLLGAAPAVRGRIIVLGDSAADLQALLDQLGAAWAPTDEDLPFVAQRLGSKRRRYGRPRRWAPVPDTTTFEHSAVVAVDFDALDPFVYADAEQSVVVGLLVPGGTTMPITLPVTLAASSGGVGSVVNGGTVAAPWTGRINGPLVNPAITHQGQDRTLDFDVNGGLTLGASEFLLIDSKARSALLNGTADRRNTLDLGSQWFDIDPGSNAIAFAADSGSGTFTITWRDAYR